MNQNFVFRDPVDKTPALAPVISKWTGGKIFTLTNDDPAHGDP